MDDLVALFNELKLSAMKRNVLAIIVIMGVIAWSCSKIDSGSNDLRQSVEKGVADISHAVNKISGTTGYKLLSMNDAATKSDLSFSDTISLEKVAGIYDFKPDTVKHSQDFCPYRLFEKTGESENMIVNLPEQLIMHPKHLHYWDPVDTIYPNNFTITATDYHIYCNWWNSFEYKLTAGLTLDDEDAGSMDVFATARTQNSNTFASKYTFTGGYNIAALWQGGDTASSAFSLSKNSDTLFMEKSMFIGHEFHRSEKYYILTIGDVDLKKSPGIDSIQVFVNDVLQAHAAEIITDDSEEPSVCHKRDILLTFDDGTTAKLSDLLAPVRDELAGLKSSLRSMYFAKHIVDYIAMSIYYDSHEYNE
jgi:hypothetical protein